MGGNPNRIRHWLRKRDKGHEAEGLVVGLVFGACRFMRYNRARSGRLFFLELSSVTMYLTIL